MEIKQGEKEAKVVLGQREANKLRNSSIAEDYCNGATVKELCIKYDLTRRSIERILHKTEVMKPRKDIFNEFVSVVVKDYEEGLSIQEISVKHKKVESNIRKILKENSLQYMEHLVKLPTT